VKRCLLIVLLLEWLGCSDNGVSVPPDFSISELLTAPDTITVEGRRLTLSTYMWRDFMPISPPDGKSLIAILYMTAADTAQLPSSISADVVWIVHNQEVWKSWLAEDPSQQPRNRIAKMARDGPKWGPGIYVPVIVRVISTRGGTFLLRADNQYVGRTD
jgi:hypothetical protein